MARRKTLLDLLDELEPSVRKAFDQALANIRSDVQIAALEAAIGAGNVGAALAAIGLGASYFRPLDEALRAAHLVGGDFTIDAVKAAGARQGVKVTGRFDSRNLRAEAILRQFSSDKIVEITTSTVEAVREALTDAITRGTSPRAAALDLVGRVGPGGVRTGGIVGLDSQKAAFVRNMADDLRNLDAGYFSRKLRDKRFDGLVRRAIKAGKPVSAADISRITARYTGRLQRLRGETIARTELLGSLHAAQAEGLQQMQDSGQIAPGAITREWDSAGDSATRDSHRAADGQIRQQGEAFDIGGFAMMYPGDQSAPASEVVNCRCVVRPRVDFIKGLAERLTPEELAQTRALM